MPNQSTRVKRSRECFEGHAKGAAEDSVTMKEGMESSDREQCRMTVEKTFKSVDNNETWTEASWAPENSAIPRKMVFKRKLEDQRRFSRNKAQLVGK